MDLAWVLLIRISRAARRAVTVDGRKFTARLL